MGQANEYDDKHSSPDGGVDEVALSEAERLAQIEITPAETRRLLRTLDLHIVPIVMILYLIAFLDRSNIGGSYSWKQRQCLTPGNAAVGGMTTDLNFPANGLSICTSIFYVTYVLFETPATVLLRTLRPSRMIPGVVILWGAVVIGNGFAQNYPTVLACRLLLGICEAALSPCLALYMTTFYQRSELALRLCYLYISSAISGVVGGLIVRVLPTPARARLTLAGRWILEDGRIGRFGRLALAVHHRRDYHRLDRCCRALCHRRSLRRRKIPLPKTAGDHARSSFAGERLHERRRVFLGRDQQGVQGSRHLPLGIHPTLRGRLPLRLCESSIVENATWLIPRRPSSWSLFSNLGMIGSRRKPSPRPSILVSHCELHELTPVAAVTYLIGAVISDKYSVRYWVLMPLSFFTTIGYVMLIAVKENVAARLAGCFFTGMGIYIAVGLHVTWLGQNVAGYRKRSTSVGMQQTLGNIGGV